ncbi:MAG: PQQ-binding-like beta-propeller repeat protein [Bryobacterales bacterium]|nr:PQQ-binding-like beta-propeller repeat protein [Bryobacterales bacterium]
MKTGKPHWSFDLKSPVWGSPLLADGKVYLGDADGDLAVFQATAEMNKPVLMDMADSGLRHTGASERRVVCDDAKPVVRDRGEAE